MARVLVIDDEYTRFCKIQDMLSKQGHAIYYSDGTDASDRLMEKWDVIFLDHDLGLEDSDGYTLAKSIADNPPHQVIVHSMNVVGAKNIVALLRPHVYDVKHIPFSTLIGH